jgi:hypothetical protein
MNESRRMSVLVSTMEFINLSVYEKGYILLFIDELHLLPIILTCKALKEAALETNRNCKFQSQVYYCSLELKMLKWVMVMINHTSTIPCTAAAEHGHLEELKWLRNRNTPYSWNELTCIAAAKNGSVEVAS